MPQLQLPIFPDGVTYITNQLAFKKENGQVTYFNGIMPVFSHAKSDIATFRMISQFCATGHVKQSDIVRAFGVTSISVKRSVKIYREKGPKGFAERRAIVGTQHQERARRSRLCRADGTRRDRNDGAAGGEPWTGVAGTRSCYA